MEFIELIKGSKKPLNRHITYNSLDKLEDAAILLDNYEDVVFVDFDNLEVNKNCEERIIKGIQKEYPSSLVVNTTKGKHLYYKTDKRLKQWTRGFLNIGVQCDGKMGNAYAVIKQNGIIRKYEGQLSFDNLSSLPDILLPMKIGNNIDWYSYSVSKYKSYDSSDEEYRGFFGEEYEDKYSNSYIDDDDDDDDDEDTNLNNNSSIDYSKINLNGNNKYSSNNYKFSDLNNSNIKLNKVNDSIDISNMEYSIPKDYIEGYSSDYMYKYGRKIEDISENQDMVELGCFFKRELTDEENLYLNEYIRFESSDSDVLDNIVNTEIINKDGVNWFKVKIDLTSSKQKIVYIYATQIDDMIFNYMYEDYDNNNEDVVNQIFDSIKLK